MKRWFSTIPPKDPMMSVHWSMIQPGQVMIRDDSAMNLPPAYFEEFIKPYDQRILQEFGGGAIHACGRVDHWTPFLSEIKGLMGFNMSQPHLNDMEKVLTSTVDKDIAVLGLDGNTVRQFHSAGRNFHGRMLEHLK